MKIYYPEFSRDELVSRLKQGSARLAEKLPLICVALFGSYAKNRQTAASDVDLLVVYRDPKDENDYSIVWDVFDIAVLEPHIYTLSQFENQLRESSWLTREVRRYGTVVFGELPVG